MENVSIPMFHQTSDPALIPISWRAILYFLYTGKITFGRLSSQPPVAIEDGVSEKVEHGQVESFQMSAPSPKSVYTLACMVRDPSNYLP